MVKLEFRLNKIYKLKGHLFSGHFWSKIIEHSRQFIDTFNYISQNPVEAMLSETAESYKYGGLYHIRNNIFDIVDKPDFDYSYFYFNNTTVFIY